MTPSNKVTCSLATEFALVKENILIHEEKITQLYIIQSAQDPLLWFGMLFVDSGLYMGAVIRFNMVIPMNYPNCSCPKIFFDPVPYHPLVDPDTGQLDTKNAFPDWNCNTHKLHQLLNFVKRVICHIEVYISQIQKLLEQSNYPLSYDELSTNNNETKQDLQNSPRNFESKSLMDDNENVRIKTNENDLQKIDNGERDTAKVGSSSSDSNLEDLFINFNHTIQFMKLYQCDKIEFKRLTDLFIQKCGYQIYDKPNIPHGDDENALIFTPWDPHLHETTRQCILAGRFAPTNLFAAYHRDSDRVSFVPGADYPQ